MAFGSEATAATYGHSRRPVAYHEVCATGTRYYDAIYQSRVRENVTNAQDSDARPNRRARG